MATPSAAPASVSVSANTASVPLFAALASVPLSATTVASPPTTVTYPPLVSRKYLEDDLLPRPREAIAIRLPLALHGPGSIQSSTINESDYTTVNHRRRPRYHVAIVQNASLNIETGEINLILWPVPSYSGAVLDGYNASVDYVESLPQNSRDRHIPMPCAPQAGIRQATTPADFGAPLFVAGFLDRRPSWVLLEMQYVNLGVSKRVNCTDYGRWLSISDGTSGNHSTHPFCYRLMKHFD